MFFEDKRQIGIFVLANIAAICANGQNYADRGNLPTGIAIEDEEEDLLHTDHYDWSEEENDPQIWPWHVKQFAHPQLDPRYCNRMTPSNVCDPDRIIISDEANRLDDVIKKIFNNTACICDKCGPNDGGIQVGIALLKHTFKPYVTRSYTIIRSFAQNLRSKWHLGNCENDILIVLATGDRQSYTDVGRAASKYISKDDALEIFKRNKSYFSKGKYYEGLQEMLKAIQNATKGMPKRKADSEMGIALISGIIVIIVIVVGVLVIVAVIVYKRRMDKKVPRCQRDETKTSSWRPKSIKMLLSSFASSSDTYQPCKTQEGKQEISDNHLTTEGHNQNEDDEILNLELAEPDPKIVDADVETTEANDIDIPFHHEEHGDEVDEENPDFRILHENLQNSENQQDVAPEEQLPIDDNGATFQLFPPELHQKDVEAEMQPLIEDNGATFQLCPPKLHQEDVVAEVQLPIEDSGPTFQTFTPQLHQEDVVAEVQLPMEDSGPTFQTFTPKLHQEDVVAEVQLPLEDNRPKFHTFASKSNQEDLVPEVQVPTENNGLTFKTFAPKSKELHQTDL